MGKSTESSTEYLIGGGAIFATILMSAGSYDFFDVILTGGVISYVIFRHRHKKQSMTKNMFEAFGMSMISTVFIVALVSMVALSSGIEVLAKIDMGTYGLFRNLTKGCCVNPNLNEIYMTQLIYKFVIFNVLWVVWMLVFKLKAKRLNKLLNTTADQFD